MATTLASIIARCVREDRYVVGVHATERLEERGILEWQVVEAMEHAVPQRERPDAEPNPVVEFKARFPDGTPVLVIWAYLRVSRTAKLVTVFFEE
jgi:hypothetical protein